MSGFVSSLVSSRSLAAAASLRARTVGCKSIMATSYARQRNSTTPLPKLHAAAKAPATSKRSHDVHDEDGAKGRDEDALEIDPIDGARLEDGGRKVTADEAADDAKDDHPDQAFTRAHELVGQEACDRADDDPCKQTHQVLPSWFRLARDGRSRRPNSRPARGSSSQRGRRSQRYRGPSPRNGGHQSGRFPRTGRRTAG